MSEELEAKCYICSKEIIDREKCRGLLDGKLGVDDYPDGQEIIFYDDDDQHDTVLICKRCEARHLRLMLHGEALVSALKASSSILCTFSSAFRGGKASIMHRIAESDELINIIEGK